MAPRRLTLDGLRAMAPGLSVFVSAGANEPVTVELVGADGRLKTVVEPTLDEALARILREGKPKRRRKPRPKPPTGGGFFD